MTKMKILFFIASLNPGGKERRLAELIYFLRINTQFDIQLVLIESAIHYEYLYDLNIKIEILGRNHIKKDPSLFFRLHNIIKKYDPDIIHSWGIEPSFLLIPTKLITKKTMVSNLVSDAKPKLGRFSLRKMAFMAACHYTDMILANSKAGLRAYRVPKKKSRLIYNGVRLDRFDHYSDPRKTKEELELVGSSYIVMMVARAHTNKDYDLLLDLAKHVKNVRGDITFIGVGEGVEMERLKGRVKTEEINNMLFLGKRQDVEKLISAADVTVLFTNCEEHGEGISNSIIEYMALGKPVITTDVIGGSEEIIEDGQTGFIVENDIGIITTHLFRLLDDDKSRKEMGEKARRVIKDRFSINRMGDELIELYRTIL
ncbi:glycosyltransferase [Desulfosediminicola sp.]|uniref:glycosyltransferase n=1 Tax=Desulfosediminicola sp. TaxID=2886825 RepID=UPI003AF2A2B3